ncbi:MAG: hypothetical protein WCL53_03135 [Chloroflexota bacterium]
MPQVAPFHSSGEEDKPGQRRMFHSNDACATANAIAAAERRVGNGGYRQCVDCSRQNEIDALRASATGGAR